ncbi:MAG: hypothetical protein ABI809_10530 [Caldimonas sp.]
MKHSAATELMHAVLDGEAGADDVLALEAVLAADATRRAEFGEWQRMFDQLGRVPRAHPPEGLVAAVLAALPERAPRPHGLRQLFTRPGVFGQTLSGARSSFPGYQATSSRTFHSEKTMGIENINNPTRRPLANRKIWIGGAVAAVAVALVAQYGFDIPPKGENVTGTIVPAQRYRAEQPSAADVKLDQKIKTQTTLQTAPATDSSAANGAADAAKNGAADAAKNGAADAAKNGAADAAKNGAADAAKNGAADAAKSGAADAAKSAAGTSAQGITR